MKELLTLYIKFALALLCLALPLSGRGADGDSADHAVRGAVSGVKGTGLVLQRNGDERQAISTDGAFSFRAATAGEAYEITVLAQPAGAHCTVMNGRGRTGSAVMVRVDCVPAVTVGGTVTGPLGGLKLRLNDGEPLTIVAEGMFTFPAPLPAGSAYRVAIDTQPEGAECRVADGAGTVGLADVTRVAVTCQSMALGFAYVLNTAARSIATYRIDAGSGGLSRAAEPVAAGPDPLSLTLDPLGRFAYVANYGSNDIAVYRIDRVTGALTATGPPIALGSYPISIAIDPAGRFAYVAHAGANSIASYRIDPASGSLSPAGAPVAAGAFPIFVALDPGGRHVYAVNYGSDSISIFRVDAATGTLTASGTTATGAFPFSLTFDPAGRFAYVANSGANSVSGYRVDAATGALSATGKPARAGTDPQFVAVDPDGRFAYVTNYSSNDVSVFRIDPTSGALTAAGAPVAAGGNPISISIDPSGKYTYVATLNADNNVSAFRINARSGALSALGPRRPPASSRFSLTDR